MSFAASNRRDKKKSEASQPKLQVSQTMSEPAEVDTMKSRLGLLEEIVQRLRAQHNTFKPLLALLARAADVNALEDQAKAVLEHSSQLEKKVDAQLVHSRELEKRMSDAIAPPPLTESQSSSSRSLVQMMNTVNDMEQKVQKISMRKKVNYKKQAVYSKDEFIKTLELLQVDLNDVQQFTKDQLSVYSESTYERLAALEERGKELRTRQQQDQALIREALEKHALFGGETGDSRLHDELNQTIDAALDELNSHLEQAYRQLELSFKNNLLSLKSTYQQVLTDQFALFAKKKQTQESIDSKVQAVESLKQKLDTNGHAQFATCREVVVAVNESLVQLNDKARRFVKAYREASAEDKKRIYVSGKVDFEQWLQAIWGNLNLLRENAEKLERNINAGLYQIFECMEQLQQQSLQQFEKLAPSANALKVSLLRSTDDCKASTVELRRRLFGIWKALNREAALQIEFVETRPDDRDAFDAVSELNIEA